MAEVSGVNGISAPPRAVLSESQKLQPTLGARTLGTVSLSTGSPALDGAAGAAVAYLVAPPQKKVGYALAGGLLTGVFGLLGLGGTLAWRYFKD